MTASSVPPTAETPSADPVPDGDAAPDGELLLRAEHVTKHFPVRRGYRQNCRCHTDRTASVTCF